MSTSQTDEGAAPGEQRTVPVIGMPPVTRRQWAAKALMIAVWMVFLAGPVREVGGGGHSVPGAMAAGLGLAAFVACYLVLVFRHTAAPLPGRAAPLLVGALFALAAVLSLALGDTWLVLFVYVAVAAGASLAPPRAVAAVAAALVALAVLGTDFGG
ncbi:sensor histidine kinase, partial [Streptomyces sp. SB3404]|nr:sensor histidine kinase [Streptomyces boncukensis]